jgi:energy-converting hydrogenase Eha subunit A
VNFSISQEDLCMPACLQILGSLQVSLSFPFLLAKISQSWVNEAFFPHPFLAVYRAFIILKNMLNLFKVPYAQLSHLKGVSFKFFIKFLFVQLKIIASDSCNITRKLMGFLNNTMGIGLCSQTWALSIQIAATTWARWFARELLVQWKYWLCFRHGASKGAKCKGALPIDWGC